MTQHQYVYPVDLTIDFDWSRVRRAYQTMIDMNLQGRFRGLEDWQESYNCQQLSIGDYGSIMVSKNLTQSDWYIWTGRLLEHLCPWADALKKPFQEAGLHFVNYTYSRHVGPIRIHIDGKKPTEAPRGQTNINFIISCDDPDAKTCALHEGVEECYPSTPGTAWLIDTSVKHWVANTGNREFLQLKIYESFDTVKEFLKDRSFRIHENQVSF